jgi:phycocyanobilin lyase subunit alpha
MTDGVESGEQLTVEQAIANLTGEDLGLRFYAAWWLGRFNVRDDRAVARLIEALGDEADRTEEGGYPLRRNAARALGKLGDRSAVPGLIAALDCADSYVREAAAQSLEMLGAAAAVPKLVERLRIGLDERGALVGGQPDLREPYDAYLEALGTIVGGDAAIVGEDAAIVGASGRSAIAGLPPTPLPVDHATIVDLVRPFLGHPVLRTQYAADRAMYQLTGDEQYGDRLIEALGGDDLQLRRAALTDVGAIGYLPAAAAIADTLAENSLKLIALKGLLEKQVNPVGARGRTPVQAEAELSPGAIAVMDLMDGLL